LKSNVPLTFFSTLLPDLQRYNALRKSIYLPSLPISPFKAISKVPSTSSDDSLVFLHPIASLAVGLPRLPEDLSLEARDCLSLFSELKKADPNLDDALEPSNFFSSNQVIAQVDVFRFEFVLSSRRFRLPELIDPFFPSRYEKALKAELSRLMEGSQQAASPFRTVVNSFADPVKSRARPVEAQFETGRDEFFSMVRSFES